MKSKTKITIIVITVLLVILVGIRLGSTVISGNTRANIQKDRKILDVTVVGTKVKLGDIEKYITLAGEIRGIEEANALPDVPGKVDKILVSEGSYVKKDQPIMYIDRSQIGFSYNLSPVRSPISGRVGSIYVQEGQFIAQTTPVATIINDSIMEVVLLLPETYITKVKKGDKAIIEVTAYPNEKFIGYVHSYDTVIDRTSRTLKIKVRVNNESRKLISGMYCNVKILVDKDVNSLYVPNTAIRNIKEEEIVYVLSKTNIPNLKDENIYIATKRKVVTGISDGKFTVIKKGLSKEEMVVSLGTEYLKDNVLVRVIEE